MEAAATPSGEIRSRASRRRRRTLLVGGVAALVGAALVSQGGFAGFKTSTSKTLSPSSSAYFEMDLTEGGSASLETAITDMMPGDYRESLVDLANPTGGVPLTNVRYQVTGAMTNDPTVGGNVLDVASTAGLSIEVRSCTAGAFLVRSMPAAGANPAYEDVYCDRDSSGGFTAGDDDGDLLATDANAGLVDPDLTAQPADPGLLLSAGPINAGSSEKFNIRVMFADQGSTDQNYLQHESFSLTHVFTADPPRTGTQI
jgi:hypothetical protein